MSLRSDELVNSDPIWLVRVTDATHLLLFVAIVAMTPEKKMLLLEVRDNGRGLAKRVDGGGAPTGQAGYAGIPHLGKGLANMRNRAKSVGGELTISSKLGAGTRVRLQVPVHGAARAAAHNNAKRAVADAAGPTSSFAR